MKIVKLTLFLNFYLIIFVCNLHIQNRLFSIFKFTAQDKFKSFKEHREEMSFKETSNYSNDKILQQGWLKYLELNEDDQVSTTQFKKNFQFNQQQTQKNKIFNDKYGSIAIPTEDYFFFELTNSKISVYSSRSPQRLENTLYLTDIVQPNGVEDLGNFVEGHCFIIKFIRVSRRKIWELCGDASSNSIDTWISALNQAKSKVSTILPSNSVNQSPALPQIITAPQNPGALDTAVQIPVGYIQDGDWSTCSKPCDSGIQYLQINCVDMNVCRGKAMLQRLCNIQACRKEVEDRLNSLKAVADGHWESLGKWSECSKFCGGGVMTLQRKCVGNNCEGEAVITKACNTMPCSILNPNDVQTMDVIFSSSKYDECKLLEGNLMMVVNNQRVLSHVLVNINSIQIFKKENGLVVPVLKMPMNEIKEIKPMSEQPEQQCFNIIQSPLTNHIFCSDSVDQSNNMRINEWITKIKNFKYNCSKKLMDSYELDLQNSINSLSNGNMAQNKISVIQSQLSNDAKNKNIVKESILQQNFEEFKRQLNNVMATEGIYEKKLENEQMEKLKFEQEEFNKQLNLQKQFVNEMYSDITSLSNEELKYQAKEKAVQHTMKQMLVKAQNKIMGTRTNLVSKLQEENMKKDIQQREMTKDLLNLKTDLGKEMMTKMGNPLQCFNMNIQIPSLIDDYCNKSFVDLEMKNNCKIPNQFCFMCCISELRYHDQEIECCYNKCDGIFEEKCRKFEDMVNPPVGGVVGQKVLVVHNK